MSKNATSLRLIGHMRKNELQTIGNSLPKNDYHTDRGLLTIRLPYQNLTEIDSQPAQDCKKHISCEQQYAYKKEFA